MGGAPGRLSGSNHDLKGAHSSKAGRTPGPALRRNGPSKNSSMNEEESRFERKEHWISEIVEFEPPPWKQAMRGRVVVVFGGGIVPLFLVEWIQVWLV